MLTAFTGYLVRKKILCRDDHVLVRKKIILCRDDHVLVRKKIVHR